MDKSKAYRVLNLPDGAGENEIKQAYKELAQKYNVDSYEAGPLRDNAAEKMDELNQAFDLLMGELRTGGGARGNERGVPPFGRARSSSTPSQFPAIRQLINTNQVEEALAELSAIPDGPTHAEWNFLMGSAYYYKGWLEQAYTYFVQAVRLDPSNREYAAALRNLQNAAGGGMPGNPYAGQDTGAQALNCACNTCSMMICMDTCCTCCRGC